MTRTEKYKEKRKQIYDSKYELRKMLFELEHLCLIGSRKSIIEKINEILEKENVNN